MFQISRHPRWLLLTLLLVWSLTHASVQGQEAAEKLRKSLDQKVTLDYSTQSFQDAVQHLKEKTTVNFVLDMSSLQQMGLGIDENPSPLQIKGEGVKLRHAVQRMLNPYNLTFVILDDAVLITTEEMGLARQMRQRVNVQVEQKPLADALKDLAKTTALNLVIDPRLAKEAQMPVTLQVEDATLETAVRLLAEIGGMKSVRLGNVLFVTNEARAEKIRREEMLQTPGIGPMVDMVMPAGRFGAGNLPPIVVPNQGRGAPGFNGVAPAIPEVVPPVIPPPAPEAPAPPASPMRR